MASRPYSPRPTEFFQAALVLFFFVLFLPLTASADVPAKAKAKSPSPVVITARTMFADNKKKIVIYKNNVIVKKDDMTMYAEEVTIYLKKGDKPKKSAAGQADPIDGSGSIDTIVAKGKVKIIQQDKTATGDEATYYNEGDKIVLTGKPRVWQGENVLNGNKITYNIKEDTFQVEDANTVLYQKNGGPVPPADRTGK